MRAKITEVGVYVDVDAPKGQDLSLVMEEMRAQYEKIIKKNAEEVKAWHESQVPRVIRLRHFLLSVIARKSRSSILCTDHGGAGPSD